MDWLDQLAPKGSRVRRGLLVQQGKLDKKEPRESKGRLEILEKREHQVQEDQRVSKVYKDQKAQMVCQD